MPKTEAIAEQNAVEVPLYTFLDVARYLRVPVWVPFALSERHLADDYGLPFRDDEPRRISFRCLAVLFIHSFLFRVPPSQARLPHWHSGEGRHLFETVWETFRRAEAEPSLFAEPDLILSQFEWYANQFAGWDRDELKKLIALHLDRVERKDDVPVRLYPFSRDPAPGVPRLIVIDPEVRFGRPTVKGAPTDVLAERWRAGDTVAPLAEDYNLTTDEVDEALRYESAPYPPPFPFPYIGW